MPVCLITNATHRLTDHLAQLSLGRGFDQVFNSSEMGVAKPDRPSFGEPAPRLNLATTGVLFVDDDGGHVQAASSIGIRAHRSTSTGALEEFLVNAGAAC